MLLSFRDRTPSAVTAGQLSHVVKSGDYKYDYSHILISKYKSERSRDFFS
jgi:hypothetical protein